MKRVIVYDFQRTAAFGEPLWGERWEDGMEQLLKHVVALEPDCGVLRVGLLAERGMRVALLEGALPAEQRAALRACVQEVFRQRNDPLNTMLRITPDTPVSWDGDQYLLLSVFSPSEGIALLRSRGTEAVCLVEEPERLSDWNGTIHGVLTAQPGLAREAREAGLLVMTTAENLPADARLWPSGTPPEALCAGVPQWDPDDLSAGLSALTQLDPPEAASALAVPYARACGAAAIILFTADGENLSPCSRFYPPIPIIAVAKRPEGEAMLLRQTLRWGTLPTAITSVPDRTDAVEEFARQIALLYGYQPGERIVASGHWVAGQDRGQLSCITL